MELFKIFGRIGVDNSEANRKLGETSAKASTTATSMGSAFRNIGQSISNNFNPVKLQEFGRSVQNAGTQISSVGSGMTKGITAPIVGATAAAAGLVGALGWKRLVSIDSAQGQLRGLGYTTEDVQRISENLVGALEGGMLTMGEATSAAASGMAAGVKEGDELTRYIQLLDAATAGSNGTFDEMNQIFARVQGSGKLMSTELDMIEQRMPGFSGAAAEALGVTQEELRKMVSQGEVSADEFLDIMEGFGGNMATEYAKTWQGMVQNTLAYIGILGEALLGGVFEQSKESIAQFIEYLSSDKVAAWAAETGASIGTAFSNILLWIQQAVSWWQNLDGTTKNLMLTFAGLVVAAGPILLIIGKLVTFAGTLIVGFGRLWGMFNKVRTVMGLTAVSGGTLVSTIARFLGPIGLVASAFMLLWQNSQTFRTGIMAIWTTITTQLAPVFERISGELIPKLREAFTSIMAALAPIGEFLMTVFVAVFQFVFPLIVTLVQGAITNVINVIDGLVTFISGVVDLIAGIFTGDWARAWEGLKQIVSGAVKAVWNLVQLWFLGKLIGIVRSLGAGLLNLFRGSWSSIASAVRGAVTNIFNLIRNIFNNVRSFLSGIMNGIRSNMSSVWNAIRSRISSVVSSIRSVISAGFNAIRAVISAVLNAIRSIVTGSFSAYMNTIRNFTNVARSLISAGFNAIRNIISNILSAVRARVASDFSSIRSTMASAANAARSAVVNAFNALRSGAINAIQSLLSTVRSIPGNIRSALGNAGTMLLNAGRSIISGLVSGIKSKIGDVVGAVGSVMSAARDLLPFSPAKKGPFSGKGWTLYSGRSITESLGEGMEDKENALVNKVRGVMGNIRSEMDTDLSANAAFSSSVSHSIRPANKRGDPFKREQSQKQDRMVALLEQLLAKDNSLYVDGKTLVGATSGRMNNSLGDINVKQRRGVQ